MASTHATLRRTFGPDATARLTQAVRDAEARTSAEIALFVRGASSWKAALGLGVPHEEVRAKAEALFVSKGLDRTKERNAVMVYVSLAEHALVVLGDEGIHQRLGSEVWQRLVDEALGKAKQSGPLDGVTELIDHLGTELGAHFPRRHDDVNELPDAPDVS